jgi:hypothetical protein
MNNIRSTVKRVALALLLALPLSGLALLGGGAPVSHAATAPTISASDPLGSFGDHLPYDMQVTGHNFTPGGRVWLGFYNSQGQFVTSVTVGAWNWYILGYVADTEYGLPGCQIDRVLAYDYTMGMYSNWASANINCIQ